MNKMLGVLLLVALATYLAFLAVKGRTKNIAQPYGLPFFGVLFNLYGLTKKSKKYKVKILTLSGTTLQNCFFLFTEAYDISVKYFLSDDEKISELKVFQL